MPAERKTLVDLLDENEVSHLRVKLDNFHDIDDESNPDPLDRAVVGVYDAEKNVAYLGTVFVKPSGMDPKEFKKHLRGAWVRENPEVFLTRSDNPRILNCSPVPAEEAA